MAEDWFLVAILLPLKHHTHISMNLGKAIICDNKNSLKCPSGVEDSWVDLFLDSVNIKEILILKKKNFLHIRHYLARHYSQCCLAWFASSPGGWRDIELSTRCSYFLFLKVNKRRDK